MAAPSPSGEDGPQHQRHHQWRPPHGVGASGELPVEPAVAPVLATETVLCLGDLDGVQVLDQRAALGVDVGEDVGDLVPAALGGVAPVGDALVGTVARGGAHRLCGRENTAFKRGSREC